MAPAQLLTLWSGATWELLCEEAEGTNVDYGCFGNLEGNSAWEKDKEIQCRDILLRHRLMIV